MVRFRSILALMLAMTFCGVTNAEEHTVAALATSFKPLVLFVKPGDTVKWVNMTAHDSQSYDELIPEGAKSWHVPIGQNGSVTLDKEGVYIYRCNPHLPLGMVAAIVVGKPTNLAQVEERAQGRAKGTVIKLKLKLKQRELAAKKLDEKK